MSKIISIYNLTSDSYSVNNEDIQSNYIELCIGFTGKDLPIYFKDVSFGYELRMNSSILKYDIMPKPNQKLISTDEQIIYKKRILLTENTRYELFLWTKHDQKYREIIHSFITPKAQQSD